MSGQLSSSAKRRLRRKRAARVRGVSCGEVVAATPSGDMEPPVNREAVRAARETKRRAKQHAKQGADTHQVTPPQAHTGSGTSSHKEIKVVADKNDPQRADKHGPHPATEPATVSSTGPGRAGRQARTASAAAGPAPVPGHTPTPTPTPAAAAAPGTENKSKAQMRAERREVQEKQRAAKAALTPVTGPSTATAATPPARAPAPATRAPAAAAAPARAAASASAAAATAPRPQEACGVSWFQHLRPTRLVLPTINHRDTHPAAARLVAMVAGGTVCGASARCVALLHALRQVVSDYTLPARTEASRGLERALSAALSAVWAARPPAPAPAALSAAHHLRRALAALPHNTPEFEAKSKLKEVIDTYVHEQVAVAADAVSLAVRAKISAGDRLLTYGCSSLVEKILVDAWRAGVRFRVTVVGARARPAGRHLLRRLAAAGVRADYVHLAALSFVMRQTDKVLLGAGALLANGWVLAHAGTAQVALVARAHNVPVLVCCETHKVSERVQTDAFVYNELGGCAEGAESADGPAPLRLTYDVTPPALVTAVVTELAVLPCTSAPVVLRYRLADLAL